MLSSEFELCYTPLASADSADFGFLPAACLPLDINLPVSGSTLMTGEML